MNYGLIGTGLMGLPLAERLLAAGLPLTLYNRSRTKAEPLEAVGARVVTTPETLLQEVDCVFLMVTDAAAVESTLLSPAAQAQLSGRTVIQMGTIAPQESRDLADRIHTAGGTYLECPVLGSIPEAQSGQLILMVGSTPEQFQQWRSVLQTFGPDPQHIGAVGTAMALKLALNQLIGSLTSGFALSLGFVQSQGVPVEQFMDILRTSALYAPTFDKKLQRMVEHNFANPNFPTKHLHKDLRLFDQEAASLGLDRQGLQGVLGLVEKAITLGLQDGDYSALYGAIVPKTHP